MKIGIDLSTTNTGIAVLDMNNKLIFTRNLKLAQFNESNLLDNIKAIDSMCSFIFTKINAISENVYVGIELSNYKNALLTNRFNLYCGAFILALSTRFGQLRCVKTFNANAWHPFIGVQIPQDTRDITKAKAREFAKANCSGYNELWSEDECDAYCIAYHLEKIKSAEQQKQEIKTRKINNVKKQIALQKINRMIKSRLDKLAKLDKNKKQYDKLKNEVDNLITQYNEVKNGK